MTEATQRPCAQPVTGKTLARHLTPGRSARLVAALASAAAGIPSAHGQPEPPPTPEVSDASRPTWSETFAGPFQSSRLFEMPTAHVVGAYQMSLSYDGSLLAEPGILSSAGVFAIGFGDLGQLEYRHTSAISVGGTSAPLPAAGVQFVMPIPEGPWPSVSVAVRGGLDRNESFGATDITEKATDGYLVAGYTLPIADRRLTVHGGTRLTQAVMRVRGPVDHDAERIMVLPTAGFEWQSTAHARLVGELTLAPRFEYHTEAPDMAPMIGRAWQGRLGLRWQVVPAVSLDASLGYRYLGATMPEEDGLFRWDIRLGGELHIPWDAIACRSLSILCRRNHVE